MKNWYIVQSHSNFENKVAGLIKEEAEKAKISDKFEEIVVPTHDVTEVKRGKRIQRKKKYFPGYVLIKSEMNNSIYHMIKNLKRVSGFLGTKGIPVPVSDNEIEKILGQIKDGVAQPKSGIEYTALVKKFRWLMGLLLHSVEWSKKLMKKNLDLKFQFLYLDDQHQLS